MFNNNTKTIIAIQQGKEMKCLESYTSSSLEEIIIIKKTDLFSFYYSQEETNSTSRRLIISFNYLILTVSMY